MFLMPNTQRMLCALLTVSVIVMGSGNSTAAADETKIIPNPAVQAQIDDLVRAHVEKDSDKNKAIRVWHALSSFSP